MNITFHRHFEKRFTKLDSSIKQRFYERLRLFAQNPFDTQLNNHALKGRYSGYRSINITGDYRAVYTDLGNDTVEFQIIDTHSNLYF